MARKKTKTAFRTTINLDHRLAAWIREMMERKVFSDFTHACEFCISQIKMFHEVFDELQPVKGVVRILELIKDALESGNPEAARAILKLMLAKINNAMTTGGENNTSTAKSGSF